MPTPSRLVRVFISSTFRDFIEERDELVKKVFPELRRRCKERFVEVLEVDLRWGITEEQSKSGETLRICLEEIDRCRPSAPVFFVGLLGERYGWIPPRDYFKPDVLEDPNLGWVKEHIDGKSVTELEILHGVLRNETMRDKSFFYFRNDGYQDRHWDAITSHHAGIVPPLTKEDFTNSKSPTPEADAAKQWDLKKRVRDVSFKWEPKDYETPKDLASLILEDLWAAINLIFPAGSVPDALERESLEHAAFGQSRTKGYVPRPGLFEDLDSVFFSPGPCVKVVLGESGGGKSALLAAWISQLGDKLPKHHFIHYIGGTPESSSAKCVVFRLLNQIRSWGAVTDPVPDDLNDAVEVLPDWLAKAAANQKNGILIVLDALNQIESEPDKSLWWLPRELADGVRIVVSTLSGLTHQALKQRDWLKNAIVVPPLQKEEKRTIIKNYLQNFSKGLADDLADRLVQAPQAANPLFLRVVLDELRLRARHENLASSLEKMLEARDPIELYVQVLKNLEEFDRERPNLIREAMGYLATAKRGLSESEILQLLSESDSPATNPLPRHLWSPLYLALEDSLVSRNGQLGFFHDYLRHAVEREYLDEDWERKKIHARFGEVAEAWSSERFSPSLRNYGLAHGAWHMRRTQDLQKLWLLLKDEGYIRAQLEAFGACNPTLDGLTEGVDAYASQVDSDIESDLRLAWIASKRASVQEDARFELIPRAFDDFAVAPQHNALSVSQLLASFSILDSADYYRACQFALLMINSIRADQSPSSFSALVEMVVAAAEDNVNPDTNEKILPGLAEVFKYSEGELIQRFAARSQQSGENLIFECADIKFSQVDFRGAVVLKFDLLSKAVDILVDEDKQHEAIELIKFVVALWSAEHPTAGRMLHSCFKSLRNLSTIGKTKAILELSNICKDLLAELTDHTLRTHQWDSSVASCWSLAGVLSNTIGGDWWGTRSSSVTRYFKSLFPRLWSSNESSEFDYALAYARSLEPVATAANDSDSGIDSAIDFVFGPYNETEQRLSSVIEVCCALIQVGNIEGALREFDTEFEVFAWFTKSGPSMCGFVSKESDGLAKIFKACKKRSMLDLRMGRLVNAVYDPQLMNSNSFYTAIFTDAITELLRKIYSGDTRIHRSWVPEIVDKIFNERPDSGFGELGSIAAAGLAGIASVIGLTDETEKSSLFHKLAQDEAARVYQRTGENHLSRCWHEAIQSGQISEAFAYLHVYKKEAQTKGNNPDWEEADFASKLVEYGFLTEATEIIRNSSKGRDLPRKHVEVSWKLLRALCEKRRFQESNDLLQLIAIPNQKDAINDFSAACVAAFASRQFSLMEAMWTKSDSLEQFVPSFLAVWRFNDQILKEIGAVDLVGGGLLSRKALAKNFDEHYCRLRDASQSEATLVLLSQALVEVGRHKEAMSTLAGAYRSASSRNCLQGKRKYKQTMSSLVEKILASPRQRHRRRHSSEENVATNWHDRDLHDKCLAHFSAAAAEAKFEPLAWALLPQIKNRKIWLHAFWKLCSTLAGSDQKNKKWFLEDVTPLLRELCEEDAGVLECGGFRLRSPDSVTIIEGISSAANSLAKLGEHKLARDIILIARKSINSSNLSETESFVPLALQACSVDLAYDAMRMGIASANDLQQSVEREMQLTNLINIIPLFPDGNERRNLLAETLRTVRKIWRSQKELRNLEDLIHACVQTSELKLALLLEKILSKNLSDRNRSERTKASIASAMAADGDVSRSSQLLLSLSGTYRYTEAWNNVAKQLVLSGEYGQANDIYRKISDAIFVESQAKVLREEFLPVFKSISDLPALEPLKDLLIELTIYPIACEELWDPIIQIYNQSCFSAEERSTILKRFAKKSLQEIITTKPAPIDARSLVILSNVAVKNCEPESHWIDQIKHKAQSASLGLNLNRVDFDGCLSWIRVFFALCSANPEITKGQVTALIAAHGKAGNLKAMTLIARSLPQQDIFESLSNAAVAMNASALKRAGFIEDNEQPDDALEVRITALNVSSQILGHGHESVVKLANSISKWPDQSQKMAYYREAVANCELLYGKSHTHFCDLANKLGIMLFESGSYEEALPLFVTSHDGYSLAIGGDAEETTCALFNSALARRKLGQISRAIEDLRLVVDNRRRLLGDSDKRTLRALDEIAQAYMQDQSWENAVEALKIAINGEKNPKDGRRSRYTAVSRGARHQSPPHWHKLISYEENLARRFYRLSEAHFANENFHDAKNCIEESIKFYSSLAANTRIGDDRREKFFNLILKAQNRMAYVFAELGDYTSAVRVQEGVVNSLRASKGDTDNHTVNAQLDLGDLMFRAKDYPACERLLRDQISRNSNQASDFYAIAVRMLAQCLVKQGLPKAALIFIREQSETSDFLTKALRKILVRLECIAGDPENAKSLAADELAYDPENSLTTKSRWLDDNDFSVIHTFLKEIEL
jgi:hypothetical protein